MNISKPKLDCKYPVGNGIDCPIYTDGTNIIPANAKPSMEGANLSATASEANLSKKFKYPNVQQDVPKDAQGQYMY